MKILIASHNENKTRELNHLLSSSKLTFVGLNVFDNHEAVEETGKTFIENATLKAIHFANKYHMPSLADDSGIEVEALNHGPGVYSKRYSGKGDHANNLKLLDELQGITNRRARFVAAIVVAFPDGKTFTFEGHVNGTIGFELKGDQGFGYDPLFIPDGYYQTMAELGSIVKDQISHRANAIKQLKEHIDEMAHYQ